MASHNPNWLKIQPITNLAKASCDSIDHMVRIWALAQMGQGPNGPGPNWGLGPNGSWAQTGPGPNGPGPKWVLGPNGPGPKWARAQMGPGPNGSGPKWGPGPNGAQAPFTNGFGYFYDWASARCEVALYRHRLTNGFGFG